MKTHHKHFDHWNKYLYLPFEYDAEIQTIQLIANDKEVLRFVFRLATQKIDAWICMSMPEDLGGSWRLEAQGEGWLEAAYLSNDIRANAYDEDLRPKIHYTLINGSIQKLCNLQCKNSCWQLDLRYDPMLVPEKNEGSMMRIYSKDLLHWGYEEPRSNVDSAVGKQNSFWMGDVESEVVAKKVNEKMHCIACSKTTQFNRLPINQVLSLPSIVEDGHLLPDVSIDNLRIWKRDWRCQKIDKKFFFDMRFRIAPAEWPGISILEKDNTCEDISADACEVNLELFVGMEPEIKIDLAGTIWKWDALSQSINCKNYSFPMKPKDGRIKFRLYYDRIVQEMFTSDGQAIMMLSEDGIGESIHQLHNQEIENIQNPNFKLIYYKNPYIAIHAPGHTANIIELSVYGLRSTRYLPENQKLTNDLEEGELLYKGANYTVFENCVKDDVYGDPYAWALHKGETVLSPTRVIEEFDWRPTPWGDMTRVINRNERWDRADMGTYPKLSTGIATIDAAYNLAVDVMRKNVSEEFAMPGQKGLMNAALFQGKGEGFGIWVRDTAHNALRIQNLLAPSDTHKSLIHITKHGFDNGCDAAAMLAIAVWDHYLATGDHTILFETLPGLLRNVDKADKMFDADKGLMQAPYAAAQDAFVEPESDGFCLSPQIFYAHMYLDTAKICRTIKQHTDRCDTWTKRGEQILQQVRAAYWNEEKACYCNGPKGSEAYEKGMWEATGAEASLWPRFSVANCEERNAYLETIKNNPKALSDFGLNWYPFAEGKNHFWNSCWVSWSMGVAIAAGRAGKIDMLNKLIFQQVRNVLMNKTFHEAIDNDTGRAWRWPGLPWHAAAFIGFIIYGVLGVSYDENGLHFQPAVPKAFANTKLENMLYRNSKLSIELCGTGTEFDFYLDGKKGKPHIPLDMSGEHQIRIERSAS